MAKKIKIDGTTYNISFLASLVLDGERTLASVIEVGPAKVSDAVQKLVAKEERISRNAPRRLNGVVSRESDKAIRFTASPDSSNMEFCGVPVWFPKSQVNLMERAMGPCDVLEMPQWLYQAKKEELGVSV